MSDIFTDPRIFNPLRRIHSVCGEAETWNHPLKAGEKIGTGSKPGSRVPGNQDCEWYVERIAGILEEAAKNCERVRARMQPQEIRSTPTHSVAGVPLDESQAKRRTGSQTRKRAAVKRWEANA